MESKAEHLDVIAELNKVPANYDRAPEPAALIPSFYHYAKRGVKAAFMSRHREDAPAVITAIAKIYSFFDRISNALVMDSETTKIQYHNTVRDREELRYVLKTNGHNDLADIVDHEAKHIPVLGDMSKEEVLFELSWNKMLWGMAQAKVRKADRFYDLTDSGELSETLLRAHAYMMENQTRDDVKIAKLLSIKARGVMREAESLAEQASKNEAEYLYGLKPSFQP